MIKQTNYVNAIAIVILSALTSVCSCAAEIKSTSESSNRNELKVLLEYGDHKFTVIVPAEEAIDSYDAFYAFWVKSADQCRLNLDLHQKPTDQPPESDDNLCLLHTRSSLEDDWKKYKVKATYNGKEERRLGPPEPLSLPTPSSEKPKTQLAPLQNEKCVFNLKTESCLVKVK